MLIVCVGILWCIGYISAIYSNDDYLYTNIQVTLLSSYVCLFVCLFLYVPLENISRKWRHHPFRWFGHWSEPSAFEKRGSFIIYLQLLFVCLYVVIRSAREYLTPCWWFKIVSASLALKEGGSFLEPHLMWQGTSVYAISSEGPPHFGRLLRQARGTENLYSTRCTEDTPFDNIRWQMKTLFLYLYHWPPKILYA